MAKGGLGTVYKAVWKTVLFRIGILKISNGKEMVKLKCLHDSQDITAEFLRELSYF